MPGEHARLAPSGAEKWLHCPGSVRMEEPFPDTESKYAAAGTVAHELAELKVRKHFIEPMSARKFNAEAKRIKASPYWEPAADNGTDVYLEYIKEIALRYPSRPYVAVEQRVSMEPYVHGGFGKCDCILTHGSDLWVVDYKNGTGTPVPVEDNPQLRLYALGAYLRYTGCGIFGACDTPGGLQTAHMAIVQPNNGGIRETQLPIADLLTWAESTLKPAAAAAAAPDACALCAGPWCDNHFCKAKARCPAFRDYVTQSVPAVLACPPLISDEEVAGYLDRAKAIRKWLDALEEYAMQALLAGGAIPHYKLVDGGRHDRVWKDQEKAFAAIAAAGYDKALLYETSPIPLTAVEKLLKKKTFDALLAEHVTRKDGKPTLAPETDTRAPWAAASAAVEFADAPIPEKQ